MKGLENKGYLVGLIISNVAALLFLLCAVKWPRIARILFLLLFFLGLLDELVIFTKQPCSQPGIC